MTRRRRHGLAACGLTLALAAAAVAGLTLVGGTRGTDGRDGSGGEMPDRARGRTSTKLQPRRSRATAASRRKGRACGAEAKFAALAYPGTRHLARRSVQAPARRWQRAEGQAVPEREGREGHMGLGRPEPGALPGDASSATRSATCRTTYVAGGRTTVDRDRADTCEPGNCRLWIGPPAAACGGRRTRSPVQPNWEYLVRLVRDQRGRRRSPSTRTTRPATRSTSAPARRTRAAPAASRASASTSRRTAVTRGAARSAPSVFNARAIGSIAVKPGAPNTLYAATTRAVRGHVVGHLGRRASRHPGRRRSGASTSRRTAARAGRSSTTAPTTTQPARVIATRVTTTAARRARRAASAASCSTRSTRASSTPARTPAASGARPTAARPGRRSTPSLNPPAVTTARPSSPSTTLQTARRGCTCYEGSAGRPDQPALPHGRRRRRRARRLFTT